MGEWKECTLSEIGTIVGGATPSTKKLENYEGGTIPWITPKDLSDFNGRYIRHGERNITEAGLNSCSTQLMPEHTVLFSSRAPIGYVAIAENEVCTNQGFKSVIPGEEIDYLFLYYLLKYNKDTIENMSSGTTFREVSGKIMRGVKVRIPIDIEEQRKIASVLDVIDSKIEENVAINKNLQEQAQALYRAWFVDYEQFSGSAPNNWRPGKLGDIATISTSSFSPEKNPDVLVEHYSIPAFDEKRYPVFEISSGIKSNKYVLNKNSVMISKLNPDTKRVWRPYCLSDLAISSTEFIVFEAVNSSHRDYIFSIIDSAAFSNHMCAHTSGSTNSRQRTMPKTTLDFELNIPDKATIDQFCALVTPMYNLIEHNIIKNQHLAEVRDSLLPKLMSGELDVTTLDI